MHRLVVWLVSFNIFRCHMVSQHLHSFSTEAKVPLVPTSSASASGQEDATIFQQCIGFRFVLFHSHPKASTAKRSAKSGNIFGTTSQALRISWKNSESHCHCHQKVCLVAQCHEASRLGDVETLESQDCKCSNRCADFV